MPRPPFAIAGIWRYDKGPYGKDERALVTSSMVTTTPNDLVRPVHPDRMPVILHPADHEQWLTGTPDDAVALITPFPADRMVVHQSGEDLKADPGGLGMEQCPQDRAAMKVRPRAGGLRSFAWPS